MARSFSRGTSDNIAYGHYGALDGASQVAFSMWVYPIASTSYDTWLSQIDGAVSNGCSIQHRTTDAGRIFVAFRNGSSTPAGYTTSTPVIAVNRWNHVVVQFDGTQGTAANRVTIYANGAAQGLTLTGTWPTTIGSVTDALKLATQWTGRLADVAIWTGVVLSPSEIAQLANRRAPDVVRPNGLIFYADLRQGTSDAIAKLPGTVSGTTLIDHPDSIVRPQRFRFVPQAMAGGGVSGALDVTLGGLACTGSGTVAIAGSLSTTLGAATLSATGTVAVAGSLSATLDAATLAGTGTVVSGVTGSLDVTLGAVTVTGTGTVDVAGALSVALGAVTLAGAGTVDVSGSVSATLGAVTITASGTVTYGPTGTLDVTLGAATLVASGTVSVTGAATSTLGALTATATGIVQVQGALASTLEVLALVATGTVTDGAPVSYAVLQVTAETLRFAYVTGDALSHAHVTGETLT